jgi:hypothetical protein
LSESARLRCEAIADAWVCQNELRLRGLWLNRTTKMRHVDAWSKRRQSPKRCLANGLSSQMEFLVIAKRGFSAFFARD